MDVLLGLLDLLLRHWAVIALTIAIVALGLLIWRLLKLRKENRELKKAADLETLSHEEKAQLQSRGEQDGANEAFVSSERIGNTLTSAFIDGEAANFVSKRADIFGGKISLEGEGSFLESRQKLRNQIATWNSKVDFLTEKERRKYNLAKENLKIEEYSHNHPIYQKELKRFDSNTFNGKAEKYETLFKLLKEEELLLEKARLELLKYLSKYQRRIEYYWGFARNYYPLLADFEAPKGEVLLGLIGETLLGPYQEEMYEANKKEQEQVLKLLDELYQSNEITPLELGKV